VQGAQAPHFYVKRINVSKIANTSTQGDNSTGMADVASRPNHSASISASWHHRNWPRVLEYNAHDINIINIHNIAIDDHFCCVLVAY